MSGRGKGGRGLGSFRPNISESDALKILVELLPKTYKTVLRVDDLSREKVSQWLRMVFSDNEDLISEVREDIPSYLNMKRQPGKIRITKKDIEKLRTKYNQCMDKFRQNKTETQQQTQKAAATPSSSIQDLLDQYKQLAHELEMLNKKLSDTIK